MTTIYFIRHGQSEANSKGIIQGHADFPLSDLGIRQAELAGKWLANVELDAIYASDLGRAMVTAEHIAAHQDLKVQSWPRLREVGLGPLEGKTREEMAIDYPQLKAEALLTSGIQGTEPVENLTERCAHLVEKMTQTHPDGSIAAVSHGGFIGIFLTYMIAGADWYKMNRPFMIGNTGITKVSLSQTGKAAIHYTNRTEHLDIEGNLLHSSTIAY
ncbi:histidine phosphatase family protein [Salipaludibacillus agaradhaerens]|uniref:histidine phosphatase family protein n=1 Tax=Salipaludibacillus agaradhaerens TaxID=76935 RepID=UPI000998239A|nr:histidine phosphatase family protein [Salipaludibacillus agaradhaerens]